MEKTTEIRNSTMQKLSDMFLIEMDERKEDASYKSIGSGTSSIPETEIYRDSDEDILRLGKNLFSHKELSLNERWENTQTIQGKIVHLTEREVFLDCLVDIENRAFEHRSFPRQLFDHISNLKTGKPILIKTQMKSGATRIDIYSGEGIVQMENFESNNIWDDIIDSGLDNKLSEW